MGDRIAMMSDEADGALSIGLPVSHVAGFAAHRDRAAAIGEVHSRPHPAVPVPRTIIQLAFVTEGGAVVDASVISEMCKTQGVERPIQGARYHAIPWGDGFIRWERHSEFSTYVWDTLLIQEEDWRTHSPFGGAFNPPGAAMSGVRLEIHALGEDEPAPPFRLDPESLCHSLVEDGKASILTDFRQDADGLTRIYILDRGLADNRRGALAQRLIEIETYRVFCMLGLSLAQSLSARLKRMEDELADLTDAIRRSGRQDSEALLAQLTDLAAGLEAQAASSLFRFGASRAYHEIVLERLQVLKEVPYAGAESWTHFLTRRIAPAMRTVRSVEERQANLSRKLSRTTQLLRTWVDVEVEKQNRNLLASMNDRARMQLRLQQTVEGLSVAAISYYVVGLASYMLGGLPTVPGMPGPKLVLGLLVPFVVLAIWFVVRRIRRRHANEPD
jgi:uncharacterized membrane-anchored protein